MSDEQIQGYSLTRRISSKNARCILIKCQFIINIWIYISAHFLIIKCFQFTCQREALGSCGPKPSSKISNHPGHRWCPLPHYILLSCMLRLVYNRKFQLLRIYYFFQLPGCLNISPSSNCYKISPSWCNGNSLHPFDRTEPCTSI